MPCCQPDPAVSLGASNLSGILLGYYCSRTVQWGRCVSMCVCESGQCVARRELNEFPSMLGSGNCRDRPHTVRGLRCKPKFVFSSVEATQRRCGAEVSACLKIGGFIEHWMEVNCGNRSGSDGNYICFCWVFSTWFMPWLDSWVERERG